MKFVFISLTHARRASATGLAETSNGQAGSGFKTAAARRASGGFARV